MATAGGKVFAATITDATAAWTTFSPILYQSTSTTRASISRTVTRAVYVQRAGLVIAQVDVTAGATSTGGASLSLPVPAIARQVVCGSAAIMGSSPPTQSGMGYMSATLDSIIVVALTNAFCDITSGQTFRYSVMYQSA